MHVPMSTQKDSKKRLFSSDQGWGEGSIAAPRPLESNESPRATMASQKAVAPPTTGSLSQQRFFRVY